MSRSIGFPAGASTASHVSLVSTKSNDAEEKAAIIEEKEEVPDVFDEDDDGLSDEDEDDRNAVKVARANRKATMRRAKSNGAAILHSTDKAPSSSQAQQGEGFPKHQHVENEDESEEVDALGDSEDDHHSHSRRPSENTAPRFSFVAATADDDNSDEESYTKKLRMDLKATAAATSTSVGNSPISQYARLRLSEQQQEEYVRRSFPMLVIGSDPYSTVLQGQKKEPRKSPHILSITSEERKALKRLNASQQHDDSATIPLYLSGDSSAPGVTLPPLPNRALASAQSSMDHMSPLSYSELGGQSAPPGANLPRARRAAGAEKARLAMQVAQQMEEERHRITAAGHFAIATKSSSGMSRVDHYPSGSSTDRPRRRSRSPRRNNNNNQADLSNAPNTARPMQGMMEEEDEEEEQKTFLTAMSPFHLPDSLASTTVPSSYPRGAAFPPPPAGGVEINPLGSWTGPRGRKAVMFERLVEAQQSFNRLSDNLAQFARRIFLARCADIGIAPSTSKREARWTQMFLRGIRNGKLLLPQNGLAAHSCPEICSLLITRLVPEEVLKPTSPVWFTELNLSDNHLGDEGSILLANALQAATSLQTVNLSSNRFSGAGIARICGALGHAQTLTSLDLSSIDNKHCNYIGPGVKGAHSVRLMLEKNKSLKTLAMTNCGVGLVNGALREVCEGLANTKSLHTLNLNNNSLCESDAPIICQALARSETNSLTTLLLRRNCLGSVGLVKFAHHLKAHHTLTKLDLARNDAGLAGWLMLSDALQSNPCMDRLNLDGNHFGSKPATALNAERRNKVNEELLLFLSAELRSAHLREHYVSTRLSYNMSLRGLSLNHCELKDDFVSKLMDTLQRHKALTQLSMSHNMIRQTGAEGIAAYLARNPPLTSLDISFNGINDAGGQSLARALKLNSTLTDFSAQQNDIGEGAAEQLLEILSNNPTLTTCNMDGNKIPYRIYRQVCDTGNKNQRMWQHGALGRQQSLCRQLSQVEVQLRNTNQQLREMETLETELNHQLEALEGSIDSYMNEERALSVRLKDESDLLMDEHRQLIAAEFTLDMDLKKKRGDLDSTVEVKRKERDVNKDHRVAAEKQIARARDQLATFQKESSARFTEDDRLSILIQSHEKRNKAMAHLIDEDVKRLTEWMNALQAKVDRGEENPYALGPGSDAATQAKKGPRKRKGSLATTNLLPRTLDGVPILPQKIHNILALSTMSEEGDFNNYDDDGDDLARKYSLKTYGSASSSPAASPLSNRSKIKSGGNGMISTLLRPQPPPVEAGKNAIVWSNPAPVVEKAKSNTNKKSKGAAKKKEKDDANSEKKELKTPREKKEKEGSDSPKKQKKKGATKKETSKAESAAASASPAASNSSSGQSAVTSPQDASSPDSATSLSSKPSIYTYQPQSTGASATSTTAGSPIAVAAK